MANLLDRLFLARMRANHLRGRDLVTCELCEEDGRVDETFKCILCGRMTCDDCQWTAVRGDIEDELLNLGQVAEKYSLEKDKIDGLFMDDKCICEECAKC